MAQIAEGFNLRPGVAGRIRCAPAESPAPVAASAERLTQVVENLLENALSFSPDGEPVDLGVETDGGCHRLFVEDRGPGIPPEHREAVFRRFFSYRPSEKGTARQHAGLGLAIVKTIAESYGGGVSARNRDGGGTRIAGRAAGGVSRQVPRPFRPPAELAGRSQRWCRARGRRAHS